jgi:hypothetical protein
LALEVVTVEFGKMGNIYISSDTIGDGSPWHRPKSGDTEIWNSLKNAIAASSGFQRWLLEAEVPYQELRLEQQVQRYLRETLENLAY